jgi:hypothetical protein
MKDATRKKLARYFILVAFLGGAVLFLRQSPQEARISVELDKVYELAGSPAEKVEWKLFDEDGQWLSTSSFDFPEELYPSGPGPKRLDPVTLKLANGTYRAEVTVSYRPGPKSPKPFLKTFVVKLDSDNREVLLGL